MPSILLVIFPPLMMLLDYYLTIVGARLNHKYYRAHFQLEHYELNPIWQRDVEKLRWFNPKHLALTAVVAGLMTFGWWLGGPIMTSPLEFIFGLLMTMQAFIIGRHLNNFLIFQFLKYQPDSCQGTVRMSHQMTLYISGASLVITLLPLALLATFQPSPLTWGAVAGIGAIALITLRWHFQSLPKG